jgi:mono/diheme cytochrome c family protein
MGCYKCHGLTGRGDGPSSDTLVDNWNEKVLPFDFTSGPLKGGGGAEGIYRTFMTGLDGTPMPSFDEIMTEQQRWDLVSYCLKLMKGESTDVAQR